MNYKKIYDDLVLKAKLELRFKTKLKIGQYEEHHIIPTCLGGLNVKENKVLLTPREHFVAHKLLVEIYPSNKKLLHAIWMMSIAKSDKRDYRISAREYERLKKVRAFLVSEQMSGENNFNYGKVGELSPRFGKKGKDCPNTGLKRSPEQLIRIRESRTHFISYFKIMDRYGEKNGMYGTHRSGEDNPFFGHTHSEETLIKMRKPKSEEHKQHLRKPKVKSTCPWCGREGGSNTMHKWHFENCKQNPDYIPKEKVDIICPHCGKIGHNIAAMKQHHFDNCKSNKN